MKNTTILKRLLIYCVIIFALLLTVSGSLESTTTYTAYRTSVSAEDSARVAKWDVTGITKNKGANIDLNVGFSEEVSDSGDWYFEIENKSEVNAAINKNSVIKFRLFSTSFVEFEDKIKWDFLGDVKDNPVQFNIFAYNESAEVLLKYKLISNPSTVISYSEYRALSTQDKYLYNEVFTPGDTPYVQVASTDVLEFTKKTELIEGKSETFFEASVNMNALTDAIRTLGINDTVKNTTFRVNWVVGAETENDTFYCYKCRAILNTQTNGSNSFKPSVTSWKCTKCNNDLIIESQEKILNSTYYKYLISTSSNVEGYTNLDGVFDVVDGENQYLLKSNAGVDFFSYLKYTSSLGGEPMFEFLNSTGTQTLLIGYNSLSLEQIETIKGYSTTSGNVRKAWEKLTYDQYEIFERHNIRLQDNLDYMSYGVKLQIIFDIKVDQVM